jgi:hypothetical protein
MCNGKARLEQLPSRTPSPEISLTYTYEDAPAKGAFSYSALPRDEQESPVGVVLAGEWLRLTLKVFHGLDGYLQDNSV